MIAILPARDANGLVLLPWVKLVRQDLRDLYAQVPRACELLPDPDRSPAAWFQFFIEQPYQFDSLMRSLNDFESRWDKTVATRHEGVHA